MPRPVAIHSLFIYPVKSCRGVSVQQAHAGPLGLEMDRRWMLVDDLGRCLGSAAQPLLSHVQPAINHRGFSLCYLHESIPRLFVPPDASGCEKVRVQIAGDTLTAYRVSVLADRWFSGILGRPVHLVWLGPDSHRALKPQFGKPGQELGFAESCPYLIAGQASLQALNREFALQGRDPLSMACFRPNIVISGLPAYGEERFRYLRAGELEFELLGPCLHRPPADPEALNQSLGHRVPFGAAPVLSPAESRELNFGLYALLRGEGELRVGMELEALEAEADTLEP